MYELNETIMTRYNILRYISKFGGKKVSGSNGLSKLASCELFTKSHCFASLKFKGKDYGFVCPVQQSDNIFTLHP